MKYLIALLLVPLWVLAAAAAPSKRPNIVFIFADDWGWGDLSGHGHPWLQTPHLDRLAREGTDFHQFNVLNPVCSPSRAAAMTGMFPSRFGIHQHFASPALNLSRNMPDWLDARAPTVARFLQKAGYRTAHFGKWHLTNRDTRGAPAPTAYGFDEFAVFNGGAETVSADLHATPENAAKFIQANKDRPFFLNVWLHESHLPHRPTKASLDKWAHLDEQKRVYAAVITDGDNAVGRVLDALKTAGVEQNTLVIFSSDNGPETTGTDKGPNTPERGYGGYYSVGSSGGLRGEKRSLFEGGVRVPFLVRWPGHTPAGAIDNTTVFTAVDLLPTLCAAAGVSLPPDYRGDGENLIAALNGQSVSRTRPIFWAWTGKATDPDWWPRLAVRDGDWKLTLTADGKRTELHRLTSDRAESNDLAKAHPDIVARLTQLALAWHATLPTKVDPSCISPIDRQTPSNATKAPAKKAGPDRAAAFDRLDTNRDSVLTLQEYLTGQKGAANLEQRFKNFDKNGDGKLSRDEFVTPSGK
ncbi:MAG: sulfatase-like hydrolase/transferase [Opitutaceae bacterium]|nr:sulfatase-like hydrolase/transferase [Opitutaceae bacterium]